MPAIAAILISTPWLMNMLNTQQFLESSDFLLRSTFTKDFLFPSQLRFIAIAVILLLVRRKDNFAKILSAFIISASLMVDGHQFIFNRNIEGDHWLTRILAPLCTLALFLIADKLLSKIKPQSASRLWAVLFICLFAVAITKQIHWIRSHQQLLRENQMKNSLFTQILKTTGEDEVIGTSSQHLISEISANTGRWVYLAPGDRTLASADEQIQRACDLVVLSKDGEKFRNDYNLIYQFTRYSIGLKSFDKILLEKSMDELRKCIDSPSTAPKYKLDYLAVEDPSTKELILKRLK